VLDQVAVLVEERRAVVRARMARHQGDVVLEVPRAASPECDACSRFVESSPNDSLYVEPFGEGERAPDVRARSLEPPEIRLAVRAQPGVLALRVGAELRRCRVSESVLRTVIGLLALAGVQQDLHDGYLGEEPGSVLAGARAARGSGGQRSSLVQLTPQAMVLRS